MAGSYKGPKAFRTGRQLAIEKGTKAEGFTPELPFDPVHGLPTDKVRGQVKESEPTFSHGGPTSIDSKPFK